MATLNKYDRQLRLWGAAGQQALGETRVVLLHPTAAGTETLKNLILPGLGQFIIVDEVNAVATESDVAVNFFLSSQQRADDGGGGRARLAATALQELNPDVYGAYTTVPSWQQATASPRAFAATCLQQQPYVPDAQQQQQQQQDAEEDAEVSVVTSVASVPPPAVTRQTLVVASDLAPDVLERVAAYCANNNNNNNNSTALIVVQSYGLTGTVRTQFATPVFPIINPKPRGRKPDLRLVQPFPALQTYLESFDLTRMTSFEFGHVPYPVLLWQAAQAYKAQQQSQSQSALPQTWAEKQHFVDTLVRGAPWLTTRTWQDWVGPAVCTQFALEPTQSLVVLQTTGRELQEQLRQRLQLLHNHDDSVTTMAQWIANVQKAARQYAQELNVQEAVENAYLAYTVVDDSNLVLDRLLPTSDTTTTTNDKDDGVPAYWQILWQALGQFQQDNNGRLPVHGSIPDMTASTTHYLQLQQIYHDQARADLETMQQLVAVAAMEYDKNTTTTTTTKNNNNNNSTTTISKELLTTFCQNIPHLDLMQRRTLAQEIHDAIPDEIREEIAMALWEVDAGGTGDDENGGQEEEEALELARTMIPVVWYWGIRACQAFYKEHGRYPGVFEQEESEKALAQDARVVQTHWLKLATSYGWTTENWPGLTVAAAKVAAEMTRYGAAEIHNVAAVLGGVASQEAVKLVTQQYTPLQNTYVFNGIASTAAVYQF